MEKPLQATIAGRDLGGAGKLCRDVAQIAAADIDDKNNQTRKRLQSRLAQTQMRQ